MVENMNLIELTEHIQRFHVGKYYVEKITK